MKHVSWILVTFLCSFTICRAQTTDDLQKDFVDPSNSAKPHTWWHWMNGNVSKEGITADLEAMHRVGVGGAQIFNVDCGIPAGPVQFMTPQWKEMIGHAIREANRLGMELCVHNCAGWSSSGGPWVKPEHAMQIVVYTETEAKGPVKFDQVLKHPKTNLDTYTDIAVLAFPTPSCELVKMGNPTITIRAKEVDTARAIDGDQTTQIVLKGLHAKAGDVDIAFDRPFNAQSLSLVARIGKSGNRGSIQVSDDGTTYRDLARFSFGKSHLGRHSVRFTSTAAKYWRLHFDRAAIRCDQVQISELELTPSPRITDIIGKAVYERRSGFYPFGPTVSDPKTCIQTDKMLILTDHMAADGRLVWDVPAGNWTIMRVGFTPNDRHNHPAMPSGNGLEVDKLSREAMDAYFADGMMRTVIDIAGPLAGKSLKNALIDSYEVGSQNWTPKFPEAFRKRNGYDLVKYLPTFAGRVINSPAVSERFLWDLRRTVADMFADNYFKRFAELCHENHLMFSVEPYGNGPFDNLQCGGLADVVMGEFWTHQTTAAGSTNIAASAAHVYNRKYVGAEAFTSSPRTGKWMITPWSIKILGDNAFCVGVNRLIFHRYAMQPWMNLKPGMTMGQWGFHFDRTNTWFEKAGPWLKYLARCQYLLQQGNYVADLCYFSGESAPTSLRVGPKPPAGYSYDGCPRDAVMNLFTVKNGLLTLPHGMTYRVLVLPPDNRMTPELLIKLHELLQAGATIYGRAPVASPSLRNYPECDAAVKRLTQMIWGTNGTADSGERKVGKGRIVWGKPLSEVLDVKPDFEAIDAKNKVSWIHRRTHDADIYFIANQSLSAQHFTCAFRVKGKMPELWNAITGTCCPTAVWAADGDRTRVTMRLGPADSTFVIFAKPAPADSVVKIDRAGSALPSGRIRELKIVKAVYGPAPADTCIDVTTEIQRKINHNQLKFQVANDLVGRDPAYGVPKELQVVLDVSGRKKTIKVAEHSTTDFPAGAKVIRARYGLIPEKEPTDATPMDVTSILNSRIRNGRLDLEVSNKLTGRDPAPKVPKQLNVVYTIDGEPGKLTVGEHGRITLPPKTGDIHAFPTHLVTGVGNGVQIEAFQSGNFTLHKASGAITKLEFGGLPSPVEVNGPWTVKFPPKLGAPPQITLEKLQSWTRNPVDGVKYFSGTAVYSGTMNVPACLLGAGKRLYLDLGDVRHFAEPIVNGKSLGIMWKPPFRIDASRVLKTGLNTLEIRVTNLWRNRLIGDEQLPDDMKWAGKRPLGWPDWLVNGTPRTSKRIAFATWRHYRPDDALDPSGLLGPVTLRPSVIKIAK